LNTRKGFGYLKIQLRLRGSEKERTCCDDNGVVAATYDECTEDKGQGMDLAN